MFAGWDWASETHDVTVVDAAGEVVDRWALRHDEAGIDATIARLGRHGPPGNSRWPSRQPRAWWWTASWRPGTRWCPSTPTHSTPHGPAVVEDQLGGQPGQVRPR